MANEQLTIPARIELPQWHKTLCFGLIGLGVVGAVVGLATDFTAFQAGYIAGFWFTFSLALLSGFFLAVGYACTAGWNVTIRRIPEAMTRWLPYAAVLGLGAVAFLFVPKGIFEPWLHPHGAHADVINQKLWWLNVPRFVITYVIVMSLLVFLTRKLVDHSYAQDEDGDTEHTWKQQGMAGPFLIIFALFVVYFTVMYHILGAVMDDGGNYELLLINAFVGQKYFPRHTSLGRATVFLHCDHR